MTSVKLSAALLSIIGFSARFSGATPLDLDQRSPTFGSIAVLPVPKTASFIVPTGSCHGEADSREHIAWNSQSTLLALRSRSS